MNVTHATHVRREFYKAVWFYFHVVWPILSLLIFLIVLFGLIISYLETWHPLDGIYFAFVTGLTIGYGDFAPKLAISRVLAILLGFNGILMTAIFASISIRAIEIAVRTVDSEK
ncbi:MULTISPECIES: potassium channel family protein [Pseudomonas]|uniref:Two pore domain potassium channel family protein n=1 Tax=Pseudomonas brassicacearum TaxID=930166 RepID=A0AAJ3FZC6_9PSED|nr:MULTISPECIES: potassium channel family protein [Pseudomonas]NUT83155.1 two pore domain potassium channel family protein [Pseudomonas brassicacearum]QGA50164.1 two pore domain potassium channel family protein [Pseudomonas brassicacearum]